MLLSKGRMKPLDFQTKLLNNIQKEGHLLGLGHMVPCDIGRVINMKKMVFLLVFILAGVPSAVFGGEREGRVAVLLDKAGMAWEITGVFAHTEPGGFYESRFCLTVVTDTFQIAIPPENLISVEVKGEDCEIRYRWMGQEQTVSGKVTSKKIGGKDDVGYVSLEFDNLKKLTFKEGPAVMREEKPPLYEATLVLTDSTKVPVANLRRITSQSYPPKILSGIKGGYVFEPLNDVGFLRGETPPTIEFDDIKSMEFPRENTIILTLNEGKSDTMEMSRKNWAYGFTGICSKGYFFIHRKHVEAIEFSGKQQ